MSFTVDPGIAAALAPTAEHPPPPPRDWRDVRSNVEQAFSALVAAAPKHEVVIRTRYAIETVDGATINACWYSVPNGAAGPAVVHAHGGGMISADVALDDPYIAGYVVATGVPILSVDYRLAPEVGGDTMARDVFAALQWLLAHADELGVDPVRVAVLGESGGGGIAAGTAILARDHGVALARQLLIYPMLDHRNRTPDPAIAPLATWTYDNNQIAWDAVLSGSGASETVSAIASPALIDDAAGLAPAYIQVGEIDVFRDEDVAYATTLWQAGVSVELSVIPGAVHGFDAFAPDAAVTRRALEDRYRVLQTL